MALQKVTLQAKLKRGTFYWVAEVEAASEEEAVVAAENLFLAEMENAHEWEFSDYNVENA
ncbi:MULTISPECIES: hypothetical protein [Kordiimonas]|uniref:hypothetical protein n=1 Tax=Kordiimonas TaxID=288021 RepID=UPI001FF1D669|nr:MULTISPECIES: hypothetical protein [Kordiimonas]MCK0069110.1 hypothetical protein [Kordiimonas laminariae]UTW58446.1 hypothetical protein KFE96_16745 [Kordiimonas sp. SCSIO 12603]